MKHRAIGTLYVVAGLLLFGAAGRAEIIEQIIVKVNGEIFTKTDLETRQVSALRQMGQQIDPNTALSDAQLRGMLDQVTPELMVNVVDEMLVLQHGRDLGYRLTDEQFTQYLDNIKKDNKLEDQAQFEAALKQEGLTMADLRKNIERQAVISRVQQNEASGKIAVSDEEARRYYDAHQAEFSSPQTVTLREIFVTVPGDGATLNVGADEEARAKATTVRERATSGDSFERLAADFSDAPSRANAGLIGPLNLSELAPELQKLIQAMKVGQISELLRSPRGYQILKLESMTPVTVMPFDEARDQIGQRVYNEKSRREFDKFLTRLRAEAIIEWKSPEIQKAYEAGMAKLKAEVAPAP